MNKYEKLSAHIKILARTIEKTFPKPDQFKRGIIALCHDLSHEIDNLNAGIDLFDYEQFKKDLENNDYKNYIQKSKRY